jgi:putative Mg2+ transporter-C (MgtC) family protein
MIPFYEIIFRLVLAAALGGMIGFEREIHGRAAGFRTQLIVCIAAVLIMIVSENYYHFIQGIDSTMRIDPARIAAGAIIGVGFLGAGVIVKSGFAIRGLTTAATIWMVSAIGLAIGGGLYIAGVATAVITIVALMSLRILEKKMRILNFMNVRVTTSFIDDAEGRITKVLQRHEAAIHSVEYSKDRRSEEVTFRFTISSREKDIARNLFRELGKLDIVNSLHISR